MKKLKALLTAVFVVTPFFAVAQVNSGGFGSTFGTIGANEFEVDAFLRSTTDYRNATYHGGGNWSNTDVVVAVGYRIRGSGDELSLQDMLRNWRNLANEERLAQIKEDLDSLGGPEDCTSEIGLIDFFRDLLHEIAFDRYGSLDGRNRHEWGALLVSDDGNVSVLNNQIYTDGDATQVGHDITGLDLSRLVSVIHNHPRQGTASDDINLENRYPSDDDWTAADNLVARGANPAILTLTVVDPAGEARIFPYSERAAVRNLSASQRRDGKNLPGEVPNNTVMRDSKCVTL